ncbi:MAG: MFS transporter [Bacteroidales bacterium]
MLKPRIITRTILLISLVSLFTDVASEMLYPVMPVYLRSIGFSVLLIGILEGIAEATAGLSKGYFGNLSDKKGTRMPFVRWGYSLSAISKPLLAIFIYPLWVFFARTLDRLGKGIRTSARDALLSDETTKEHKAKVFGFHRSLDTFGAAIGPVIALIYLYFYPEQYKWLFIIAFFPGLLAVFITFLIKEKRKQISEPEKDRVGFLSYLKYWKKSPSVYKRLVIGMLVFTVFNSSDVFLLLALKHNGLSDVQMIGFYIFYNLIYALLSYPLGAAADKLGMKTVLVLGLFVFSIVYTSMAFASNFWLFGLLFFLYAMYAASTESISKAWISNICDKSETATAIGFFTSFSSICTLLASSFAGFLWFYFSPAVTFMVSGIGVSLVVIYFLFALPGLKKQNAQ